MQRAYMYPSLSDARGALTHSFRAKYMYMYKMYVGLCLNYKIYSFYMHIHLQHHGCQSSQEHRGEPLFDKFTGFCCMCYTTHGTTGFQSIRRTQQWLSVLLTDTSVTTGTPTHTLLIRNNGSLNLVLLTAGLDTSTNLDTHFLFV